MQSQHFTNSFLRVAALLAAKRMSAAGGRFASTLKYNPNWNLQPRVPAGDPDGGQWMPSGRAMVGSILPVLQKLGPPALRVPRETVRRISPILRRFPRRWDNSSQFPDESDYKEKRRGMTSSSWQRHGYPNIRFRSEGELRRYLGPAGRGREWHHIVEKRLAGRDGFPVEVIHSTDNIISLPRDVHRHINARMSSRSLQHGGVVLRYWVERLPFEKQYNFGLDLIDETLKEFGYDPARF